MNGLLHLTTERLNVELSAPGSDYLGTRFDWTTGVRQVTLDGKHTFLTRENLKLSTAENQGWGLSGEFGIASPVGYDDCKVGDWFPKIGVGWLQRTDEKPYDFFRRYPLRSALFETQQEPGAVTFLASCAPERGYGWHLRRQWKVEATRLTCTTTLGNTGNHPLSTEEYIHNFLGFGTVSGPSLPVGATWKLDLGVATHLSDLAEWVNPEGTLLVQGTSLGWAGVPQREFFLSRVGVPTPSSWSLAHEELGVSVRESVDFAPTHFNLWGKGHVASPELFAKVDVAPGGTWTTVRAWEFMSRSAHE